MPLRWCFFSGAVHRIPVYHTSLSDLFFFQGIVLFLLFSFYLSVLFSFRLSSRLVSSYLCYVSWCASGLCAPPSQNLSFIHFTGKSECIVKRLTKHSHCICPVPNASYLSGPSSVSTLSQFLPSHMFSSFNQQRSRRWHGESDKSAAK